MDHFLIILLSVQKWTICGLTPPGCLHSSEIATCDFRLWTPPLLDRDFGLPVHDMRLNNINGTIPDGVRVSVLIFLYRLFSYSYRYFPNSKPVLGHFYCYYQHSLKGPNKSLYKLK